MSSVTNRWIAEQAQKVFTNTPAFNAEVDMAGREDALASFRDIVVGAGAGRTATISDLLGAGKTFFIQHALSQLHKEGQINEAKDVALVDYREAVADGTLAHIDARVLIVEELDRRSDLELLNRAVSAAAGWLQDNRVLVLTGDFSLQNAELLGVLGGEGSCERLVLEPLDANLLQRALELRFYKGLRQMGLASDEALREAAQGGAEVIADDFLKVLLPPTDPSVANFREVLGVLQRLAECLPLNEAPCRFSSDAYREWVEISGRAHRRRGKVAEFVDNLYYDIRRRSSLGERWTEMQITDFPWLSDMPEDAWSDYEVEVMDPLVRSKVLLPMGVPYDEPHRRRTPGPYLPTVQAFLEASFSEAPG